MHINDISSVQRAVSTLDGTLVVEGVGFEWSSRQIQACALLLTF